MGAEPRSEDSEIIREAMRAVRARRPGRDPAAVRAALEEEMANRGLSEPRPELVERMTRMLVAAQGPFASLRVTREMWNTVAELRGLLKGKQGPEWLKPPAGYEVGIPTNNDPTGPGEIMEVAEVDLGKGVQPFLARAFEASYDSEHDDEGESQCKVWIDTRRPPASGAPLPVILGQELIGTLDGEDALALERDLCKAEKKQQPLILEATLERRSGRFSVWVVVPPTK